MNYSITTSIMYILVEKQIGEQNPFNNTQISEEQIGEITQSEKILQLIVGQYLANIRLNAYALTATPEEYATLQTAERVLNNLLEFVHSLPEAKKEFDRLQVIKEAEEKAKSSKKI